MIVSYVEVSVVVVNADQLTGACFAGPQHSSWSSAGVNVHARGDSGYGHGATCGVDCDVAREARLRFETIEATN